MKFAAFVVFAFVAFVAWAGSPVSFAADGRNISSVNGSVKADAGETYGNAEHRQRQRARRPRRDRRRSQDRERRNRRREQREARRSGAPSTDRSTSATTSPSTRTASTVNGSVELGKRSRVGGDVSTVYGEIETRWRRSRRARSSRSNGDIELTDGARVRGGIHVKKNNGSNWGWGKDEPHQGAHLLDLRRRRRTAFRSSGGTARRRGREDRQGHRRLGHAPLNALLRACGRTAAPRARRGAWKTCARSSCLIFRARGSMRRCPRKPRR